MTCQTAGQVYKMCKVYHIFRQHLRHYKHWNGQKNRIYDVLHIYIYIYCGTDHHTHTIAGRNRETCIARSFGRLNTIYSVYEIKWDENHKYTTTDGSSEIDMVNESLHTCICCTHTHTRNIVKLRTARGVMCFIFNQILAKKIEKKKDKKNTATTTKTWFR